MWSGDPGRDLRLLQAGPGVPVISRQHRDVICPFGSHSLTSAQWRFPEAAPRDAAARVAATGWRVLQPPSVKPRVKDIYRKHRPVPLFHMLLSWRK